MNFIPVNQIQWKQVGYLRQGESRVYDYQLMLNEPLASWDVWDYWERERVKSMEKHLKKGDKLFDIGTEQGWCDIVYAKIVGPQNMVLVEPTPEFWPNIKAVWNRNFDEIEKPLACFPGFFSSVSTLVKPEYLESMMHAFPTEAYTGKIIDKNSYKNLFDQSHTNEVAQITLDDFVESTGIIPDALTIDVEGAELLVLAGAEKTLREHSLKVWVSEHDDLAYEHYHANPTDVSEFMEQLGYVREVLATDHERHVYYSRPL